ncbi:MAG TPA: ATP-dependent DNA helicase RecG [Candidatus Udaeobacter sp.]|nr:ATP-dependent DNA helicase RecG [Candidatus Udaeobacter sp.]
MLDFNTSISELGGVGKKTAKKFAYLGVKTAKDLLYYFPFRYEDYRTILPIAQLQAGQMVTICGQVELIANKKSFRSRKTITEALVSDKSGSLRIVWFNQPFITKNLQVGDIVYLSGKVQVDMLGPKLTSPIYEKFSKDKNTHTARLVPIYSTTHGLTQKQIRFLIKQSLDLADKIKEWLPESVLEQADLAPLASALRGIHFPIDDKDLKLSTDRLKFDELFLVQLQAELARQERSAAQAAPIIFKEDKIKDFIQSLPFTLTKSQKISTWEILQDIAKTKPMNRLVSGDVGSGKTVVAAIAAYDAFLNGYQVALMAPTEILAQQHYQSLTKLFSKLNINIGLLTGSQTAKVKKEIVGRVNSGEINIIVGTHALLTDNVNFKKLGLVIVDEQHRFGVEQRKLIKQKGLGVHFLSMTATPIPRSLALVIYGDLDISIINELPPGRKKIITRVVEPANRSKAYDFIQEQIKKGRQAFIVCPLIEESKDAEEDKKPAGLDFSLFGVEKKTVMAEYKKLSENIFPDLRIGFLHGKLKPLEKEGVMAKFKSGSLDLLVATSVIEVGIDIPNASIMMIEGAESFGLAQLHQFRGRVGRSQHQSYCLLFTNTNSQRSLERLKFFEQTSDGFKLAEKDLEIRGPGEVYGKEQSGEMNLHLAKLTDRDLIKKARDAAKSIILNLKDFPQVLAKVKDWENKTHLE